jgi:hypothetical protein
MSYEFCCFQSIKLECFIFTYADIKFPKYIQLLIENCKIHIFKKKTRWRHFGLAAILKYQLSEITYNISRHFQNVFIYLNRLENAKTISQKRKCSRWRHLGLTAILKCATSEIAYVILRLFHKTIQFLKSVQN